jgi:signal transduction histidine kinase/DNA-binding response OmpR family regulator
MSIPRERILVVENDPEICDLIARQTLQPSGYHVQMVGTAAVAIQEVIRFSPDVILADLQLPDLSGKDLLVAFSSQGIDTPVILLAEKGMEGDIIQAFRLGATDYLHWPAREAEVLSAVERATKLVRARREREALAVQVKRTNHELHRRVRELTTIFALGKAVTSITDQRILLEKIVEGAVYVTEADSGWLLLREDRGKAFFLVACRNLPTSISEKMNQPWEDGISSLVALSGESLSIYGEPLKHFKVSSLGQSAMVVPVKARKEVVGLLVVVRKQPLPFTPNCQALLEAIADYASVSLINARLFKALEERAQSLQHTAQAAQMSEQIIDEIFHSASAEIQGLLEKTRIQVDLLSGEERSNAIQLTRIYLNNIQDVVDSASGNWQPDMPQQKMRFDVNALASHVVTRFQKFARQNGVELVLELSPNPIFTQASPSQIMNVFESLLSNAVKYSLQGGKVSVRVDRKEEEGTALAHVFIKDAGIGIDSRKIPQLFDRKKRAERPDASQFGGLGIGISLAREIIQSHGGKIWVESELHTGSIFNFTLQANG